MRVAYQAGVIRALIDGGLTFSHADGTSGGTINLAMLLSGLSPSEMCERWRTLQVRAFASFLAPMEYLRPSGVVALGSATGVVEKVFPHLGIDIARINAAEGLTGSFNVANFATKTNEVIPSERLDMDYLVGGISLPMVMPAVRKNGGVYVDSVWIKDANCMEAMRRGADEIWLVWCIDNTPAYRDGLFNQYVHMIELAANGALFGELERIRELNERIAKGEKPDGHIRPIRVHIVKPEYPLPLDPDLYSGKITTASLIDMGYRDAIRYLRTRKPDGVPLDAHATQMREPGLGLAFREVMTGPFAMSESDPRAGARRGRDTGQTLTMHASIEIVDIDRFLVDPEHTGTITGDIDYSPLGERIPAKYGEFNLFSPGDRPDVKYMVYELGFEVGGQDYYLAGRKEVRNDRGFDMWRDTTTLYSRLHRGRDATGPVIGAGVLSIGVSALLRMLTTVAARNAQSVVQRGEAVAKFGAFFSNRLYEMYLNGSDAKGPSATT